MKICPYRLLEMSDSPDTAAKTSEEDEFPDTEATLQLSAEEERRNRNTPPVPISKDSPISSDKNEGSEGEEQQQQQQQK